MVYGIFIVMLGIVMPSIVMLSVVILRDTYGASQFLCYAECHYADCLS